MSCGEEISESIPGVTTELWPAGIMRCGCMGKMCGIFCISSNCLDMICGE